MLQPLPTSSSSSRVVSRVLRGVVAIQNNVSLVPSQVVAGVQCCTWKRPVALCQTSCLGAHSPLDKI
jgi:hypothetical protein